jgi:flagellar protein FliO/FliZ
VSLGYQSLVAVLVVLGLVVALAWLVRRGAFSALRQGTRAIAVETAVPIGERRSLIIVAVEGRRLLLGLTPGQISMVTELGPVPVAPVEPGSSAGSGQSFEQILVARAKEMFTRGSNTQSRLAAVDAGDATNVRFGDILQLSAQQS